MFTFVELPSSVDEIHVTVHFCATVGGREFRIRNEDTLTGNQQNIKK
jgi:hypothetical protein